MREIGEEAAGGTQEPLFGISFSDSDGRGFRGRVGRISGEIQSKWDRAERRRIWEIEGRDFTGNRDTDAGDALGQGKGDATFWGSAHRRVRGIAGATRGPRTQAVAEW